MGASRRASGSRPWGRRRRCCWVQYGSLGTPYGPRLGGGPEAAGSTPRLLPSLPPSLGLPWEADGGWGWPGSMASRTARLPVTSGALLVSSPAARVLPLSSCPDPSQTLPRLRAPQASEGAQLTGCWVGRRRRDGELGCQHRARRRCAGALLCGVTRPWEVAGEQKQGRTP